MDRTAAIALIVANLVLATFIGLSEWGYYQAIAVYWLEALIIGFFSVCKLYAVAMFGDPFGRWAGFDSKLSEFLFVSVAVGFFLIKFGGFVVALAVAVALLPAMLAPEGADQFSAARETLEAALPGIAACAGFLFASHGISFGLNFIRRREYEGAGILYLLFSPYVRLACFYITLVIALAVAVLQPVLSESTAFALALVAIKLAGDLLGHRATHRRLARKASRARGAGESTKRSGERARASAAA